MASMSGMKRLMGDLGLLSTPNGVSATTLDAAQADAWGMLAARPPATAGKFADEYLLKPSNGAAVTSTRSAGTASGALKKAEEEFARQSASLAASRRLTQESMRTRKIASLCWMAMNHPDKLGRHATANIEDLKRGQLPRYSSLNLDAELIDACHLANFRRDPARPPYHSDYVAMVERAMRDWNETCDADLKAAAGGITGKGVIDPDALLAAEEAREREIAYARAEQMRLAQEKVRQLTIARAEERQANLDQVVDELIAEGIGGDW